VETCPSLVFFAELPEDKRKAQKDSISAKNVLNLWSHAVRRQEVMDRYKGIASTPKPDKKAIFQPMGPTYPSYGANRPDFSDWRWPFGAGPHPAGTPQRVRQKANGFRHSSEIVPKSFLVSLAPRRTISEQEVSSPTTDRLFPNERFPIPEL